MEFLKSALVGIGIRSGDEVDGITKIYCAKMEPVCEIDGKPSLCAATQKMEIHPPTDTEEAKPATPARDLRMIPHIQSIPQLAPQEAPQYNPPKVPQRQSPIQRSVGAAEDPGGGIVE